MTRAKEAFNAWLRISGGEQWGRSSRDAVEVLGREKVEVPAEAVRKGSVTRQDVDVLLHRYPKRNSYQEPGR